MSVSSGTGRMRSNIHCNFHNIVILTIVIFSSSFGLLIVSQLNSKDISAFYLDQKGFFRSGSMSRSYSLSMGPDSRKIIHQKSNL